jgi:hypothetical protein
MAEQLRQLVQAQAVRDKHVPSEPAHKDKLLERKLQAQAHREASKQEKQEKKAAKEEERLAKAAAERLDRAYFHPDSKRAAKDERVRCCLVLID